MGHNVDRRVRKLEEGTPPGYHTYDSAGAPVIASALPSAVWHVQAQKILQGPPSERRELLLRQLAASRRAAEGGGLLHEFLYAVYADPKLGPDRKRPPDAAPGGPRGGRKPRVARKKREVAAVI